MGSPEGILEIPPVNPDTRVVIWCYAGDQHHVIKALGQYLHHQCPVVVLSPGDLPAEIRYPGIENRISGHSGWVGQVCIDRMLCHFRTMLTFPETHFLVHEDDSVCLSPEIPRYLYEEPDTIWANAIANNIPEQQQYYPDGFPKVALQAPYFISRGTIEKLLKASESVKTNPGLPYGDHYLVQLALQAGVPYKGFWNGITCGTNFEKGLNAMFDQVVYGGAVFLHSIKDKGILDLMIMARKAYVRSFWKET